MAWKDKVKTGVIKLGKTTMNMAKKGAENYLKNQELYEKKKQLLNKLTMPQLKKLADDFDANIEYDEWLEDNPRRDDFIDELADTLDMEQIEEFVRKNKLQEKVKLLDSKSAHNITIIEAGNLSMNKSSITGYVKIDENVFNDFSLKIMNSDIDLDTRTEALRKIEELKIEIEKREKDKGKIDKICKWFTNNKTELATLSIPFITKILSMIKS